MYFLIKNAKIQFFFELWVIISKFFIYFFTLSSIFSIYRRRILSFYLPYHLKKIFLQQYSHFLCVNKKQTRLSLRDKSIEIKYTVFPDTTELSLENRRLMEKAQEASFSAYAPYSKFRVGAAVLLDSGVVVVGNNQENVSYPEGLCAERVAVFAAMAQYPQEKIKTIAIYGNPTDYELNHFVTPCGACRQVLMEYEQRNNSNICVLCGGTAGEILTVESIKQLLPFSFKM